MDNFTHSLVGWTLGQAGLKQKTRKGLAALILGANMADLDVFLGWVPWAPLATHRGFTHSLIGGTLLMPPILAGLLWALDRWQVARGGRFKSGLPMHFGWLLALCYLGALTHPLLDLQTSYAVQLFSPFSDRWAHQESLFIIDVWIWTGLAFAIWLSRRRERRGGNWRQPAIAGLVALCAYIGLNSGISALAKHALRAEMPHASPDIVIAGEEPVLFWRRDLVWRQNGLIGRALYDPIDSLNHITNIQPMVADNMARAIVRRAMRDRKSLVSFLRWSILPMAQVEHMRCADVVIFTDARYGDPPARSDAKSGGDTRSPFLHRVIVPSHAPRCAKSSDKP